MARAHLPVRVSAVSRQPPARKTPYPACHRLWCSWAHWHRGSAYSGPSGRTFAARTVTLTHHVQRAKTHTPARVSALNRQRRTRKVSDPACYRLRCPWGGWHRSSVHSRPSGRSFTCPSRNPHLPSLRVNGRRHSYRLGLTQPDRAMKVAIQVRSRPGSTPRQPVATARYKTYRENIEK